MDMHDATYTVLTRYLDIAPSDNAKRAAWFAKFGPLKGISSDTTVTASYEEWLWVGAKVDHDGTIRLPYITKDKISEAVTKLAQETSVIPETLPPEIVEVVLREAAKAIYTCIEDHLLRSNLASSGKVVTYGLDSYEHMIPAASLEATRVRLVAEAQARVEKEEERKAAYTLNNEREKAESEAKKKLGLENTAAIIQKIGNGSQYSRLMAGLLPDEELYETLFNKMFSTDDRIFTGLEGIRDMGFKGQASDELDNYKVFELTECNEIFWEVSAKFDDKMLGLRNEFPELVFDHKIVELRSNGDSFYGVRFEVKIPSGLEFQDFFVYGQI